MIGNILITLATAASVFTIIMYYMTFRGYENTLKYARLGYHAMAVFVIAASALLLHAILTHQYEYEYVFNYSGSGLPTGLLMSTFYAGQQGSFLLWLFFTVIIGLVLQDYTAKRGDLEYRVMMIFTVSAAFLLIMINPALKSPFNYIWSEATFIQAKYLNPSYLSFPFISQFSFSDPGSKDQFIKVNSELVGLLKANGISITDFIVQGKGLNPLLQNFWMQIHPPILFSGFAMSTVPFSFAFAALMKNDYKDWVKQALPWLTAGMMVLGLAIMLGGYWAYGVLGWGGYWGWDPVENSSLVPWIIGVAAIHTMLVQKKTQTENHPGRFLKINLLLSIGTYLLVLYSTFLTRSGILGDASVHSFVAPGTIVFLFLLLFIGTFTILGIAGIVYRWKSLEEITEGNENLLSRELALFTGSIALIASALIVLAGTSAPIWGTTVEVKFYNELNLPIAIIIGLLNGFSLIMKWRLNSAVSIWKEAKISLIATAFISLLIVLFGGVVDIMLILLIISSVFALVVNSEVLYRVIRGKRIKAGAYLAHIGIALFLLGVVASGSFTQEERVTLVRGENKEVFGHTLNFTNITPFDNGQKYRFNISVDGGSSVISPIMFIADFNNSLMREPDILSRFTSDFYIAPVSYADGSNASSSGQQLSLSLGDTHTYEGKQITFKKFDFPQDAMSAMMSGGDFKIGAIIDVAYEGKTKEIEVYMKNTDGQRSFDPVEIPEADLSVRLSNLNAAGKIDVVLTSLSADNNSASASQESLTIEASIKPFIGLVWLGVLVTVAGFFITTIRRTKESKI